MASSSSKKFQETRHPLYRGVRKRGASDRWVSEVREPNKKTRLWLGTFPTADMAARAHDLAVLALHGRSAGLNFADSAWLLHLPDSFSSVKDIKRAAIEVAELFRPRKEEEMDLEDACSSTSADVGPTEEKEVTSSSSCISNSSSKEGDEYDAMMFDLGRNGEMDLGSYYASLAEGLLMEPPVSRYEDWYDHDHEGSGIEVPLWS